MIEIHPLVITSACDQGTRIRRGGSKLSPSAHVLGLLFGVREGDKLSVVDTVDISVEEHAMPAAED
eukprot:gene40901-49891_t